MASEHLTSARLSIDVTHGARRRIRLAAARSDQSIREYVLAAVEAKLKDDLPDDAGDLMSLTESADPVLADLWDNPIDAVYDEL